MPALHLEDRDYRPCPVAAAAAAPGYVSYIHKTDPCDGFSLLFFLCFVEFFGGWCADFVDRGRGGGVSCMKRRSHNSMMKPADHRTSAYNISPASGTKVNAVHLYILSCIQDSVTFPSFSDVFSSPSSPSCSQPFRTAFPDRILDRFPKYVPDRFPEYITDAFPDPVPSCPTKKSCSPVPSRQPSGFPPSRPIPIPRSTNGNIFPYRPSRRPKINSASGNETFPSFGTARMPGVSAVH